ncbi:anaphase-promoting complex subunit 1 isoform X2 [Salvelinus fontinalis]|uniref:anaphase-promoting complex subunit 1 isoform X2 n=1 Tax=Salvelinus fontinalis TaxID=8038 RepID=UPI0024852CD4|nr:anaphase-promoting complex subunit 1 isoform X2 [Salvelinus fontinalis]
MSLQQKECWLLRKGSSVDSDENEELYAAGNMVIWSRGSKSHASHVYKAFTVGSPVVQIPWLLAELREVEVYSIAFEFSEGSPLSGPSFSASSSRRSLGSGPVPEGAGFPPPRARQSRKRRKRILLVCEQDVMEQTVYCPEELCEWAQCDTEGLNLPSTLSGLFEAACVQYVSDSTMKIVFFNCKPSIVI